MTPPFLSPTLKQHHSMQVNIGGASTDELNVVESLRNECTACYSANIGAVYSQKCTQDNAGSALSLPQVYPNLLLSAGGESGGAGPSPHGEEVPAENESAPLELEQDTNYVRPGRARSSVGISGHIRAQGYSTVASTVGGVGASTSMDKSEDNDSASYWAGRLRNQQSQRDRCACTTTAMVLLIISNMVLIFLQLHLWHSKGDETSSLSNHMLINKYPQVRDNVAANLRPLPSVTQLSSPPLSSPPSPLPSPPPPPLPSPPSVLPSPSPSSPMPISHPLYVPSSPQHPSAALGMSIAESFPAHMTDVIISDVYRVVYVDNVKAASTTIREILAEQLSASWACEGSLLASGCCHFRLPRTTTKCLNTASMKYLAFSFVRDPVAKFESGVREARAQYPAWVNKSADEVLRLQLDAPEDVWLNEHLQSSAWRLSGTTDTQRPVSLGFVGRLESFGAGLRKLAEIQHVMARLAGIPKLPDLSPFSESKKTNHRPAVVGDPSLLSPAAICAFCMSYRYRRDYLWFNYSFPAPCCSRIWI